MKKIMLLASALCLAFGMQAATVSWKITGVKGPDGTALSGGSVYLFMEKGAASATDTSWVAALAGNGADAVKTQMNGAKMAYNMAGTSAPAGTYSYVTDYGFTLPSHAALKIDGETKYTLYAVIFDTAEITDSSKFYVTNKKDGDTLEDASVYNKAFTLLATSSGTAANWNAVGVPEPTSGLLLLVGASLLALRRKQK